MNERILGIEKISKLFVKFAIPGIFGTLAMGVYTIINGIFLGKYAGSEALASVNIVYPLLSILSGICIVISIGMQSIVGIKLGEKKYSEAQDCFKSSSILIMSVSIIIPIFLVIFSQEISRFLGATDEIIVDVDIYLRYCAVTMPFFEIMFFFDYAVRVIGQPILATVTTLVTIILNIVLEYYFIGVLGMGITGVGLGVGISYFVGFVVFLFPLMNKKNTLNLFAGKFQKAYLPKVISNGLPEGISSFATAVSTFVLNILFLRYYGNDGVAAFSIIGYIAYVGTLLFWGICDGIRPIISYNFGEKKHGRIFALLKISFSSVFIIDLFLFLALFYKGHWFISFFINNNEPQVNNLTNNGMKFYAFVFLFNGINTLITGYLTSIGDSKLASLLSFFKGIIFVGIGIFILPLFWGTNGVWLVVPFAEALTLMLSVALVANSFKIYSRFTADPVEINLGK